MKYFVGTAVGKKDINSVGKRSWDCTGRCNIDFFFSLSLSLFIHVGKATLVLSPFIMCVVVFFTAACGMRVFF